MKRFHLATMLLVFAFTVGALVTVSPASAASAEAIDRDAQKALGDLYAKSPSAKAMGEKALGILVFPGIVKGGFIVGGGIQGTVLQKTSCMAIIHLI
jgi:lipid-binding SYLF domain-containing protein